MTSDAETSQKKPLKGIGGWLLLPLIGLPLSPIVGAWLLVSTVIEYASALSSLNSIQITFVVIGLISYALLGCVAPLLLFVLLLRRSKLFPQLSIALQAATVLLVVCIPIVGYFVFRSLLYSDQVPIIFRTSLSGFFGTLVGSFVWSYYLTTSVRVKNTFVN